MLRRFADVADPDSNLKTQADALRAIEAELQGLLHGDGRTVRNASQLFSRAAQLTASGSTTMIALGNSGSALRQEQMRAVIASIRQHEHQSQSIYDGFHRERITPADPDLSADVAKTQRAYDNALKLGDGLAISDASLTLHKARMADVAHAFGSGDPNAEKAYLHLKKIVPKLLEDQSKAKLLSGASQEVVEQERHATELAITYATTAAAQKGAQEANRVLSERDKAVLTTPSMPLEENRFAALAPDIESAKPETSVQLTGEHSLPDAPSGIKPATSRKR